MTRNERGQFAAGTTGNPNGRPLKQREQRFLEVTLETVSFADWKAIIEKARDQAKRGNAVARKFLADYLIGPPVVRQELFGPNGGAIPVTIIEVVRDPGNNDDAGA